MKTRMPIFLSLCLGAISFFVLGASSAHAADEGADAGKCDALAAPQEIGWPQIKPKPVDVEAELRARDEAVLKNPQVGSDIGSGFYQGRFIPSMAARFKVVYTIGGRTYKFEDLADKNVRLRLKNGALERAFAIDARNGNRDAFDLVIQLLQYKPGYRVGEVDYFDAVQNGTGGLEAAKNPSLSLTFNEGSYDPGPVTPGEYQARVDFRSRFTVGNDLLNQLFEVDSMSSLQQTPWTEYHFRLSQIRGPVSLKGPQISDRILDAISGGGTVQIQEQGSARAIEGWVMAAKRVTDKTQDRIMIRLAETSSNRPPILLDYDMKTNALESLKIKIPPMRFGHEAAPEGMKSIRLDPGQSNVATIEREVDLSKPVRVMVLRGSMGMPYKGMLKLPTEEEKLTALAARKPMQLSITLEAGDNRPPQTFDALNIIALDAYPKPK